MADEDSFLSLPAEAPFPFPLPQLVEQKRQEGLKAERLQRELYRQREEAAAAEYEATRPKDTPLAPPAFLASGKAHRAWRIAHEAGAAKVGQMLAPLSPSCPPTPATHPFSFFKKRAVPPRARPGVALACLPHSSRDPTPIGDSAASNM